MLSAAIAIMGGAGAITRYLLDTYLKQLFPRLPQAGIWIVNALGSLLLGFLTATLAAGSPALAVAGTGFCGGFTTFSTAVMDGVTLAREKRTGHAVIVVAGTLLTSYAACALGLALGALL